MSEEIKNNNWATPDEDAVPTTLSNGGTADPLDIDVNDIKTGYPIITAGLYDMVLEATLEDNKDKTGKNIVLKHKTTRVAKTPQGEESNPVESSSLSGSPSPPRRSPASNLTMLIPSPRRLPPPLKPASHRYPALPARSWRTPQSSTVRLSAARSSLHPSTPTRIRVAPTTSPTIL